VIIPDQDVEVRWSGSNRKYLESKGYEFTAINEYVLVKVEDLSYGSAARVSVQCDYCGSIYTMKYGAFNRIHGSNKVCCTKCWKTVHRSHDIEMVKNLFLSRGYTPLFSEYNGARVPLQYRCSKHPDKEQAMSYDNLSRGKGCRFCYFESNTGPNHPSWKGGGRSEYVKVIRTSADMKSWKLAVFHRDDFTCVRCGVRGGRLNAHHILPFHKHKELRLDINNGATLCWECHSSAKHNSFHHIYGHKNVTLEDFTEFLATTKQEIPEQPQ